MIKKYILTTLIAVLTTVGFSQINASNIRRGPCFVKSVERLGQRYVEWECGDNNQVVDCNEALELDPGSNLIFSRNGGQPFTGTCETCHQNGLKEHKMSFVNGRVSGTDTSYYDTGCPQVVRNHIDGAENGTWTYYQDSSGLVAWEINYFNGEKHGRSIYFRQRRVGVDNIKVTINGVEETLTYGIYENDTVKIEHYSAGILDGNKKEYFFTHSLLKRDVNYKQGVLDGAFIEYNREGNKLQELNYNMGKKDGDWKYYYDNGNLLRTESWKNDVKEGEFKTFYIQGNIQSIQNYRKGVEHGEFIERFPDDKIKREAYYKKGVLIEEHVYDKFGNEISTFGADANKNTEDDELPSDGKQKKAKKKKKNKQK